MTGQPLSEIRGPGPMTVLEIATWREVLAQEDAQRRYAAQRAD
jgi:hypothetical protein